MVHSNALRLSLFRTDGEWINKLILQLFPSFISESIPHFFQTWIRNYVFGMALYLGVGAVWCYYAYFCFRFKFYKDGIIPKVSDIFQQVVILPSIWRSLRVQIWVASVAMPMYALLPTVTDVIVESGCTKAYPRVDDVGLPLYILYFFVYMTIVEFGVYWMHRLLHEIKPLYKILHSYHHVYNKQHTLSPFAGTSDLNRFEMYFEKAWRFIQSMEFYKLCRIRWLCLSFQCII